MPHPLSVWSNKSTLSFLNHRSFSVFPLKTTSMAGRYSVKRQSWRAKSPGWAAFGHKQRGQECASPGEVDPFPPISCPNLPMNDCQLMRSFSSVVCAPDHSMHTITVNGGILDSYHGQNPRNDVSKLTSTENNIFSSIKSLKTIHEWADESLIRDILEAVENVEERASEVMEAMVLNDLPQQEEEIQETSSYGKDNGIAKADGCSGNQPEIILKEMTSMNLVSAPFEPEWEEDDIYLSCRRDALKMMRLAAKHSRAASNAFQRGDHLLAHQLSLEAREDWTSAEKLNAQAAKEILRIRNSDNDAWKLDLHGLHVSEAVTILKDHLQGIETNVSVKHPVSAYATCQPENKTLYRPPHLSDSRLERKALSSTQQPSFQERHYVLHVITGTGNHSRGHAALPTAVRSFLIENGYRFEEARPGVVAVRPKFRRS